MECMGLRVWFGSVFCRPPRPPASLRVSLRPEAPSFPLTAPLLPVPRGCLPPSPQPPAPPQPLCRRLLALLCPMAAPWKTGPRLR